jgi:hypothetical protein
MRSQDIKNSRECVGKLLQVVEMGLGIVLGSNHHSLSTSSKSQNVTQVIEINLFI